MAEVGKVSFERGRGWHLDFGMVEWSEGKRKRVRITHDRDGCRLDSQERCLQLLAAIRERYRTGKLTDTLAEYVNRPVKEACVPHRWTHDFVAAREVDFQRGEISADRLRDLRNTPKRGYLAFWDEAPVHLIDTPSVTAWYDWLRATFPHLKQKTMQHILSDFRTFCRFMKRRGALLVSPDFPSIKVARKKKNTPARAFVETVIGHMDPLDRGPWMGRCYAGLRPSEARRVDVGDYDFDTCYLRISAEKCKTKEPRTLPLRLVAPKLVEWIETHRRGALPWEPLFPAQRSRDKRWRNTPERRVLDTAFKAAGYEPVPPNIFGRHSFATHEVKQERTEIYGVSKFLGHSDIKTTEAYLEVDAVALERRMRPVPLPLPAASRPKTA